MKTKKRFRLDRLGLIIFIIAVVGRQTTFFVSYIDPVQRVAYFIGDILYMVVAIIGGVLFILKR